MKKSLLHCLLAAALLAIAGCGPAQDANSDTSAQSAQEAPAGRLPEGVRPLAYRLDLLLDPRRDDFSGSVEIDIQLDHPAQQIWLHGKDLQVQAVRAQLADGREIPAQYRELLDSGVAAVRFAETLPAGDFTLHFEYSAPYDRNLAGLFKVEAGGHAYALAKSESIQARRFLPGFDEPGMKASFDVSLTVPEGHAAIGNNPEISRAPAGPGLEKVTFSTTPPMSTYLLSLSVGPFEVVERAAIPPNEIRPYPVPLRGFARRGRGAEMAYILDVTPRMLEIFERQLQRPYPYEKLDVVAAPQWPSGATELSAAPTYREERILTSGEPAPGMRLALLGIHAHELAHMWFGNLVTPPWWDDLWLKEGFATWGTPLALGIMEPQGGHELNAAVRAIDAMQMDSLASTRAVREPILDNHDIRNAYDSITYAKGLAVIRMADQYFGPEKFRPALGRYIQTFADGVADSPDFYRVIGEETDTPELAETFRSFVEQKGVPQLQFELECEEGKQPQLHLAQSRYKPLGSAIEDRGQRWSIPLCLRAAGGAEPQCLILTEARHTVPLETVPLETVPLEIAQCPQWIMPNARGSGYYRWNLPQAQWQALIRNFPQLTPEEALSTIDSAFAAFEAGQLPAAPLLQLVRQSAASPQRQVITAPLPYLEKYSRQHLDAAQQPALLGFAQSVYQPLLEASAGSNDSEQQLLHSELLGFMALTAKDRSARQQLRERAHAFTGYKTARDENALDSDRFESALSVAVQDSDQDFLPHLVGFSEQLDDARFNMAAARAIGRSDHSAQLDSIQQLVVDGKLQPIPTYELLYQALTDSPLQQRHWQWLQGNFPQVVARLPEQWRRNTPHLASGFCDREKLAQLQQLFSSHGQLAPGHQRSLAQTEERIQLCMALKERGAELAAAL